MFPNLLDAFVEGIVPQEGVQSQRSGALNEVLLERDERNNENADAGPVDEGGNEKN